MWGPAAPDHVYIGPRKLDIWPSELSIFNAGHPEDRMAIIPNPDIVALQAPLIEAILAAEPAARRASPPNSLGSGGQKIRGMERFGLPVFELLNARALELFRRVTGAPTAVADNCWANVSRNGEYSVPHSHRRATAGIVYALQPGDVLGEACDPLNGALIFCDPRLKSCSRLEPNSVTDLFRPTGVDVGVMVIFPGNVTHAVCPYFGETPRISIAWNVNAEKLPGDPDEDLRLF